MSSTNYINQVIKIYKKKSNYLLKDGDLLKLKNIPKGTPFHSLEAYPGSGPIYSRAAGVCSYLLGRENKLGEIKLSSKTSKFFDLECSAILGVSSNKYNSFNKKYKAGTNRLLNKRPIVRGVAMNPVDHPHGGGEGKGRPGRPSVSP
jgi:large subunit ribosomal protein L2